MRDYVVKQLKEEVIPTLEKVSGVKFDIDRLRQYLRESAQAEDDLVAVLRVGQDAGRRRSTATSAASTTSARSSPRSAARRRRPSTTACCARRSRSACARQGPITPDGEMHEEKYRLVVEGPPNWTSFRDFWQMFYDEGAVVVASTYTKVGGIYDFGFRHDPDHPLESLADYCLGCYTNLNLPSRVELLAKYINEYQADGLLINSSRAATPSRPGSC